MNAAEALAELGELERFLGALNAQQLYGDHICCAAQPETVNGSPEVLIEDGRVTGAEVTGRWAEQIVEAIGELETEAAIRHAILTAAERFDVDAFAKAAQETILRGLMLGALDSVWERESGEDVAPATFAAPRDQRFVHAPFSKAVELFEERQVLPPAAYRALEEGARKQAFTVAGLAKQELLAAAHAELARQLREGQAGEVGRGANLRDFKRFAEQRLESAGWTPANPSHVETIFRTNGVSAYSSGRAAEMSQPKVLAALPYWQIQTVRDARQRPTHGRAHGIVLPATHVFWQLAYPPFGFNCRCRVCARTKAWLDRMNVSVGPTPQGLPDPGFESGLKTLIQVPAQALAETPRAPARPRVPQRGSPNQLPLPYVTSPVIPPPAPAKPYLGIISPQEINEAPAAVSKVARKAKKFLQNHAAVGALESYTGGAYRRINGILRDPAKAQLAEMQEATAQARGLKRLLSEAKDAGHSYAGVVQRGEAMADLPENLQALYKNVRAGDELFFPSFTSATALTKKALHFADGLLLRIRQQSGVPISAVSLLRHEQEVLLPPGRRLRVLRRFEEGGNIVLDLEEL